MSGPLFTDVYLLVTCSLCAKKEDRFMQRDELDSVQIFHKEKFYPVHYFKKFGPAGVSAFAWQENKDYIVYGTTGDDLFIIDTLTGNLEKIDIDKVKDIHEITIKENSLWLSNTGFDECLELNLSDKKVKSVVSLKTFLNASPEKHELEKMDAETFYNEKFHCNQIFFDLNNEPFALTHHVTGRQLLKKIAQKFLKTHGSGGVINLKSKKHYNLHLDAPHNVRIINNGYWVCNSGKFNISVYDKDWNFQFKLNTQGWGRGFAVSNDLKYAFIGISATRKRYLSLTENKKQIPNMIEVFDIASKQSVAHFEIPNVEQVNNVYLITEKQAHDFLKLSTNNSF